jgi:pimeloyl-ACP methyl ester carboxylesterase
MHMPYLTRDGVRLYYEDHGQGLPALLSHGFGASTGMWRGQVEALQQSYRLIPWDMRGHGESDSPEAQALYSHQHTVEDMRAMLDHLHIDQAVIAGHSLGGFMSLAFHVAYPQRVLALILQGCGPGYRNAEARATWNARAEQRAHTLETQGLSVLGGGSEVRISTQRSALGLAKAARGILAQADVRVIDSLPHIRVSTLIIVGEGDTPFVIGSHYMASRIPRATEVVVKNAAHGANVDQPEVVNEAIRQFLARL